MFKWNQGNNLRMVQNGYSRLLYFSYKCWQSLTHLLKSLCDLPSEFVSIWTFTLFLRRQTKCSYFPEFSTSFHSCEDTGELIRRGKKSCTHSHTHTHTQTPNVACSSKRKSNHGWYIGKCQTRINGLITLLSILRVLSLLKFPIFFPALPLSALFFTALIGSVKGAGDVKNQSHRQKTLGRI